MRALLFGCGVLLLLASATAEAQRRPIAMRARGLFGDELLLANRYIPVLVEVENRTGRTLRGRVVVDTPSFAGSGTRYEVALDLPARERRQVVLTPFLPDYGLEVSYEIDGTTLAATSLSTSYQEPGIVVLDDPPRIRSAILEIEVVRPDPSGYGPPRSVRLPVGEIPYDLQSRDPILPDDVAAWAAIDLLVASAPALERVGERERMALADWVRSGGRLIVFTRTEGDLTGPALASFMGSVSRGEPATGEARQALVPRDATAPQLSGPGIRAEAFGGSRRFGFGRVFVATFDGCSPPHVLAPETRELVRAIASVERRRGVDEPLLPQGKFDDDLGENFYNQFQTNFGPVRRSLDPNEGYKPALGIVAVLLLLYVLVIGPLNFTFVGKRNKPTLALVTTPAAAAMFLVLMLGVGYIGKGARTRYRAVDIVEVVEGDTEGPARRYYGLFPTRPMRFDLDAPARGLVRPVTSATSDARPIMDQSGEPTTMRGATARLWETVFVREERIADLGGAITFERSGNRIAAVENGTSHAFAGAVLVDPYGATYPLGAISAGGRVPVPSAATATIPSGQAFWGVDDTNLAAFSAALGFRTGDREMVDGVSKLLGGTYATGSMPTLIAWYERPDPPDIAGAFSAEREVAFVRVVPDLEIGGGP
jgi:hypothetical protein